MLLRHPLPDRSSSQEAWEDIRDGGLQHRPEGPSVRPRLGADPALRNQRQEEQAESARTSELAERFEEVARLLRYMDVEAIWTEATKEEQRVLVEELVEAIAIFPDHLEVTLSGVPRLNVALDEVGLTGGWQFCGVGGPIGTLRTPLLVQADLLLGSMNRGS